MIGSLVDHLPRKQAKGVRFSHHRPDIAVYLNGRDVAFEAKDLGSIPSAAARFVELVFMAKHSSWEERKKFNSSIQQL